MNIDYRNDTSSASAKPGKRETNSKGHRKRLGDILVESGIITEEQREAALKQKEISTHRHLGSLLVEMGYTGEEIIREVLAGQLGVPFVHLEELRISPDVLELISEDLAHRHSCVPVKATKDGLTLAMSNPFDLIAIQDVEMATERNVELVVATQWDIAHVLAKHYVTQTDRSAPQGDSANQL